MKTFIYLLTATLSIAPVHAATFDFPAVDVAYIKAQWGAFDAPQATAIPYALDGTAWSEADFDVPGPKVARSVKVQQGHTPRAGGSLYGSTFRWERDQRAAWGGGIPGLTSYEGQGGCGPIAAEALVRLFAGNSQLNKIREIFNLAENKGYWSGAMKGPGSEQKLLADLGIQVGDPIWISNLGPAERMIRESLDRGKPVIISTNRHYFLAEGYNNNGQLFVGYTGEVMRGGAAQMSLSEISRLGSGGLALLIPK
jgi:hypothetical protein